jgi:RHS repeat-associated protein
MTCSNLPFGDSLACNGSTNPPGYHFTGKERDTESGNDYFGARYYASSIGRWLSPDWSDTPSPVPYADLPNPQSLNLYGYVRNNPLRRTDADGHCDIDGEHHGWLWCAAHALGVTETAKEDQTRLANEANGFIASNHIGLIYVNGQWVQPSSATNTQLVD